MEPPKYQVMKVDDGDNGSGFTSLGEFVIAAIKAQNGGEVDQRLGPRLPEPPGFTEAEIVQMEEIAKELTEEEKAAQLASEKAEILERCAAAGDTKMLTEDERAKVANEPEFRAVFAEERRVAKEKMLARNAARIKELGSKMKPSETLEQYDDRVKGDK